MPRPKNPNTAAVRTRKDTIVSMTMPHATRVLTDMLADARGLSRSEYFRYLVLQDAQKSAPRVLAEALTEGVKVCLGRPSHPAQVASQFAVAEENARLNLVAKFPFFENADALRTMFVDDDAHQRFLAMPADAQIEFAAEFLRGQPKALFSMFDEENAEELRAMFSHEEDDK